MPSLDADWRAGAMNELVRFDAGHGAGLPAVGSIDLVGAFLSGRKPTTLRAYAKDLEDFARYLGQPSAGSAVDLLILGSQGQANAVALGYKADLMGRKLATATVARRLAALRSMVKLARTLGRVSWTIEVQAPKTEALRDTRGPGLDGWRRLLATATAEATTPKGRRDLALIHLMRNLGLRRAEAASIELADLDLDAGIVRITGKGKTEASPLTLNTQVKAAIVAWLADRGDRPGPLFHRLDPGASGPISPLDGRTLAKIVGKLGRRAGLSRGARCHGLRHEGITRALDLTGGDVRRARQFSRHSRVETLMRYDDNRRDEAGSIAAMLGEDG